MEEIAQPPDPVPVAPGRVWLREGARVLGFRSPRWEGLEAGPATVVLLVLANYLLGFALQWALIDGDAQPVWQGFLRGWLELVLLLWLCWVVARSAALPAPSPATLLALCAAADLVLGLLQGAVLLATRAVLGATDDWPMAWSWTSWLLPLLWIGLAQLRLLWRVAGSGLARFATLLLVPLPLMLSSWLAPIQLWWVEPQTDPDAYRGLALTDEVVSQQPQLLADALNALRPPQAGRINVYGLSYAPYASEDVFMRESAVVNKTLSERFDAEMLELVTNPATLGRLPWATPSTLRKSIAHIAALMDRERDVLFIHLTSHGGADGKLASNSWPLQTEDMTPALLKQWLDEAGVRWRVISVSACYAGSWIAPLAGDSTLVLTAADAEHTSYGCGRRSPLTFYGQAMYVDALRSTRSFEDAHAQARKLIEVREREAGKEDGYSNPQLSMGVGIRERLQRLQQELDGASAR